MMTNLKQRSVAIALTAALALALTLTAAACGGETEPESATTPVAVAVLVTASAPPTPTTAAPVAPTTAAQPAATASAPTAPAPTAAPPEPTPTPLPDEPTPEPTPAMSDAERQAALAKYAEEHKNEAGAIFVGDTSLLLGPPPHPSLMLGYPESAYTQISAAVLTGLPGVPAQTYIYESDYYLGLLEKANLANPTELTSAGEIFEIQHVCIDRKLPTCTLIQTYFAPNLAKRTNGQVQLSVSSFVELGLAGPDTLSQVADGSLDMVNIYTGYVSGAHPALEVQSLWGLAGDWETSYLMLTDLAPDIDRMIPEITGGSHVVNRNWFAGSDQWFFSKEALPTADDFKGRKIRTHAASMSDFIRGMGAEPVELSVGEIYTALQIGTVDATVTTALLGVTGSLYEVADYMAGPLIGFGYTNNVINKDVWDKMPADLQQIMMEEGAKMELEALRLAPYQNFVALDVNKQAGVKPRPFTDETRRHIEEVVLTQHILPGWLRRLNYPDSGQEIVNIYNDKVAPYSGLSINPDGSIARAPITKGPRAE